LPEQLQGRHPTVSHACLGCLGVLRPNAAEQNPQTVVHCDHSSKCAVPVKRAYNKEPRFPPRGSGWKLFSLGVF